MLLYLWFPYTVFFQEPYMEVVNPFILKNKERMVVFLDQLSSVQDPGNVQTNSNNNFDIGMLYTFSS